MMFLKKIYSRKRVGEPKFRNSLQPGTVLILLSGKFRGSRVLLLNNLKSGLLLVTGPYAVNGVPLRRVNPAYVIATSTKVNISGVQVPDHFNDEYFKRPAQKKEKKTPEQRFEQQEAPQVKKEIDPKRVADQKTVDDLLLPHISEVPQLKEYLRAKFSLDRHQYPHNLKF